MMVSNFKSHWDHFLQEVHRDLCFNVCVKISMDFPEISDYLFRIKDGKESFLLVINEHLKKE